MSITYCPQCGELIDLDTMSDDHGEGVCNCEEDK